MVWAIGLTPISKGKIYNLKIHLLLCYLTGMLVIVSAAALVVYQFVAYSLKQQFEEHLLTVAESAARTLEVVKHEYEEYSQKLNAPINLSQLIKEAEATTNNQLNFNWEKTSGIEWFNEQKQLLIKEGNTFPNWSLLALTIDAKTYKKQGQIISLILPVYGLTSSESEELVGYIRVTETNTQLTKELNRLQWGLILGGIVALILSTGSAILLTKEWLKPLEVNFTQLQQFTADASHELRTPLTVIKANLDVILSHPERIDPIDIKKLKAISSATNQMKNLVEDLLLLAQIERNSKEIKKQYIKIPIDEIWEDLLDFAEIEAKSRQITLQYQLTSNLFVKGDANYLQRLFANILNNALQYTPKGGKIKVYLHKKPPYAIIIVEDTGIGIGEDEINYIFERFWRGKEGRHYRKNGTGLGLAIAGKIINDHHGNISVASELGKGSCFTIYLPLALP